jgi:hypothetical protein
MEGHGSASVALQSAGLHRQQHQPAVALQHLPAAAAVTREAREKGLGLAPPLLLLYAGWPWWVGLGRAQNSPWATRRPHRPTRPAITRSPPVTSSSRSPSDPPHLSKSPENLLNFNLALRLLSFIYSDLLVLYIYVLDLELFCNFYIVTNNIICIIRYMYLCNLNVIITAVIIHVYDLQIISRY